MTIVDRIDDFADLVALVLVLVLVTLFTAQRATAVAGLDGPSTTRRDALQEVALVGVLGVVTVLLFLAGLPLFIDAVQKWHPTSTNGPLLTVFILVWLLLIPLCGWQIALLKRAVDLVP